MLQNPELDSKDIMIGPDLHQPEQMAKAVDDGSIKCFNLLSWRVLQMEISLRI